MSIKKLLNKIATVAIVAATSCAIATPALAQYLTQSGFWIPSASFFSPRASIFQSEDAVDLATILKEYPTFYSALEEADLLATLEQQEFITVLAPTEEAFATLAPEIQAKLAESDNLKKVLQYHLVEGQIDEEDIKRQTVATLLEDNEVRITGVREENNKIGVKLNEAKASEALTADNGVIIPIDQVLIPPNF
ncbi:MAG: fasciclin domain-containing protein [Pleurocapsa sp.]